MVVYFFYRLSSASRCWGEQMLGRADVGESRCWGEQMLGRADVGESRCWGEQMLGRADVGESRCCELLSLRISSLGCVLG